MIQIIKKGRLMAKCSDTLETVKLALELFRRIPRQLEQLSKHFDTERDERNKPYGYRWLEQAKVIAVPNLTAQESLLLQLAEAHLKNLLLVKLMKSMEGFFEQARRNLDACSTATFVDSAMLAWWLRGFGDSVRDLTKEAIEEAR